MNYLIFIDHGSHYSRNINPVCCVDISIVNQLTS